MNNWEILKRELKYHGIILLNDRRCQVSFEDKTPTNQGIIKTMRQIGASIRKRKNLMQELWNDISFVLSKEEGGTNIVDENIRKIFIHSLKDLLKFLLCFSECDNSYYTNVLKKSLSKDVTMFSKDQIYKIIQYKMSIDWMHRLISKLIYIRKLLYYSLYGEEKINALKKEATGVSGPWSNLDLPMKERVFPFGQELNDRRKDKQRQRRYKKGLENYNNDGRVGEGHYWRELRNEPFSWYDRKYEDPYPSRHSLSMWG